MGSMYSFSTSIKWQVVQSYTVAEIAKKSDMTTIVSCQWQDLSEDDWW